MIAVIATGPSLKTANLRLLEQHGVPCIAVADSYQQAPWAELMYAADPRWWKYHDFAKCFSGRRITQPRGDGWIKLAEEKGLEVVTIRGGEISFDPSYIGGGYNSGFQALNLAIHTGEKKILLLGFDCGTIDGEYHYFGRHPYPLKNTPWSAFALFRSAFNRAAEQLKQTDIRVINCSMHSHLTCFPKKPLEDCI